MINLMSKVMRRIHTVSLQVDLISSIFANVRPTAVAEYSTRYRTASAVRYRQYVVWASLTDSFSCRFPKLHD